MGSITTIGCSALWPAILISLIVERLSAQRGSN
jgi:hypothetical protein